MLGSRTLSGELYICICLGHADFPVKDPTTFWIVNLVAFDQVGRIDQVQKEHVRKNLRLAIQQAKGKVIRSPVRRRS